MDATFIFSYYFSMGSVVPFYLTMHCLFVCLSRIRKYDYSCRVCQAWNVFEGVWRRHHVIKGDLGKYMDSE